LRQDSAKKRGQSTKFASCCQSNICYKLAFLGGDNACPVTSPNPKVTFRSISSCATSSAALVHAGDLRPWRPHSGQPRAPPTVLGVQSPPLWANAYAELESERIDSRPRRPRHLHSRQWAMGLKLNSAASARCLATTMENGFAPGNCFFADGNAAMKFSAGPDRQGAPEDAPFPSSWLAPRSRLFSGGRITKFASTPCWRRESTGRAQSRLFRTAYAPAQGSSTGALEQRWALPPKDENLLITDGCQQASWI